MRNWRYFAYAIAIVLAYVIAEMVLQNYFGAATYDIPRRKYFFAIVVLAPIASVATSLFALGEEMGWRGFLQNLLIKEYGMTKGLLILGVVWGLWHMPVALMGYNLPEHPVIEAFLWYPLFCISLSFFLGWLSLRGRSIWWAVLGHGANNGIASMVAGERPEVALISRAVARDQNRMRVLMKTPMKRPARCRAGYRVEVQRLAPGLPGVGVVG